MRTARVDDRQLARQRARGLPHDRGVPLRPGAGLPAGRPPVHPLLQPRLDRRRGRRVRPQRRPGDRLPAAAGRSHRRGRDGPQHRVRGGLARRDPPRPAAARDGHRHRGAHRHREGVHGGQAALRVRRGRPAVRLRHGRDGSGDPAPHLGPAPARCGAGHERPPQPAPGQRLPADPPTRADPGRRGEARPRHARRGARRGPRALVGGQRLDRLPDPRGARRPRSRAARPPQRPGADLPLRQRPRALPPGLPELWARRLGWTRHAHVPDRTPARRAELRRRRGSPDRVRRLRRVPRGDPSQ